MKLDKTITLEEVASFLGLNYCGDPKHIISGINEIHKVESGDFTYVDHPKYYDKVLKSKATTILLNKEVPCPEGKALLFSDEPFEHYIRLVNHYRPFVRCEKPISDKAIIGEGTIIQPGVFLGHNVIIGKNCIIHSNVSIYDHCIVRDNVVVHANSVIGGDAYYFKKQADGHYDKMISCGRVILEDDVEIGCLCTIDRGVSGDTIIGKGTKFDNHVQVGHDTVIGKNCLIGNRVMIAGVTEIKDDVILWAGVAVQKDLVIGKGSVLLALSAVDKDVPPGKVYFGVPAEEKTKKWREHVLIKKLPEMYEKLQKL